MKKRQLQLLLSSLLLILVIGLFACQEDEPIKIDNSDDDEVVESDTSPEFQVLFTDHTGWTYNKNIYEVNIRQYTQSGTFNAFATHLPRLKEMGVKILWLMPIHPIGEKNQLGTLGSHYAVKDYKAVNPNYGTMDDFKNLVEKAHDEGMYVMLDWVANHTAWDNVLTESHPEYYLKTGDGNFQSPPGTNWSDVIQLDHSNDELKAYMIQTLKEWVYKTGIDGYRFDYVDGVPADFWNDVTTELKTLKPDIFLLAEGNDLKYYPMGFDMNFAWNLHGWGSGLMLQIYEGTKTVGSLDNFLTSEKTWYMPEKYRMYFTSNHDENSWEGTVFEQFGESYEAFAVLTQTLYGMPLLYNGQEAGLNKRLQFFEKDPISWNSFPYENFYTNLNNLRDTNRAMWHAEKGGLPERINTNNDGKVFAFAREKGSSRVVVLLNLSSSATTFTVNTSDYNGNYTEIFSNDIESLSNQESISLDPWEYKVLVK